MHPKFQNIQPDLSALRAPVLIVSSFVGRGNYSIGEGIKQQFGEGVICHHLAIEDLLPDQAVEEDLNRYKWISQNAKFLLYLIYTVPFFYQRKYIREKWFHKTDLSLLEQKLRDLGVKTVICVSHRPAFWLSILKERAKLDIALWGVLAEFGTNLGWQYIFWDSMNGFFSIMPKNRLRLRIPSQIIFQQLPLPCRKEFYDIAAIKGSKDDLLIVAGYWGQVNTEKAIILTKELLKYFPALKVHIVCGTNETLEKKMRDYFGPNCRIKVYGKLDSLIGLLRDCAAIITKPGFATLIEAYCASRKIFLLKGMPVAEDHNAAYAIANFSAEWHSRTSFKKWYNTV